MLMDDSNELHSNAAAIVSIACLRVGNDLSQVFEELIVKPSIHSFVPKVIHQNQPRIAGFSFHRRVGVHYDCGDPMR